MKRLAYLVEIPPTPKGDWFDSPLASARYRVLLPGAELRRDWQVEIITVPDGADVASIAGTVAADAVIVSKSVRPETLALGARLKAPGRVVLADFCDDHFGSPKLRDHMLGLARTADAVVASTRVLAEIIRQETGREALIIPDPVEGPTGRPRFRPKAARLKLCWFGNPQNLEALPALFEALFGLARSRRIRLSLEIVTSPEPGLDANLRQVERQFGGALAITLRPWSPAATWRAIEECDLVVLPSLPSRFNLAKGANRMLESIRGGRLVIAHPLPAYQEFSAFGWVGEHLDAGLSWALDHAPEAEARIKAGQDWIDRNALSSITATAWQAALSSP